MAICSRKSLGALVLANMDGSRLPKSSEFRSSAKVPCDATPLSDRRPSLWVFFKVKGLEFPPINLECDWSHGLN